MKLLIGVSFAEDCFPEIEVDKCLSSVGRLWREHVIIDVF